MLAPARNSSKKLVPSASEKAKAVIMSVPNARMKLRGMRWPVTPVRLPELWRRRNRTSFAVRVLRMCWTRGLWIEEREYMGAKIRLRARWVERGVDENMFGVLLARVDVC